MSVTSAGTSESRSPRLRRPWLFALDHERIQLTWADLDPGPVRVEARRRDGTPAGETGVDHGGGPGTIEVCGLPPFESLELTLVHRSQIRWRHHLRTEPPGPGPELFRLATVSDTHIGDRAFGYFGTIRDPLDDPVPAPERCLAGALAGVRRFGAQLLVAKGDLTSDGRDLEWQRAGELLRAAATPIELLPGNHDNRPVDRRRSVTRSLIGQLRGDVVRRRTVGPARGRPVDTAEGIELGGLPPALAGAGGRVGHRDLPGLRLILCDTTLLHRHLGTFTEATDEVADLASQARRAGLATMVLGHHHPMPLPFPHFWPPGVPAPEASRFFSALAAANPDAFYSAGHTHRHRRYDRCGVVATEVGSPKDYPGTWAAYTVYEGGLRQTVRRVDAPDALVWLERTRTAALGTWGRWSPGRLRDRCFLIRWRDRRPHAQGTARSARP